MRTETNHMHDFHLPQKGLERSICAWQSCYLAECEGIVALTGVLTSCLEQNRLPSLWILALVKETCMEWFACFQEVTVLQKLNLNSVNLVCKSYTNWIFRTQFHPHEQFSLIWLKEYLVLAALKKHFRFSQLLDNMEIFSQLRDLFTKNMVQNKAWLNLSLWKAIPLNSTSNQRI